MIFINRSWGKRGEITFLQLQLDGTTCFQWLHSDVPSSYQDLYGTPNTHFFKYFFQNWEEKSVIDVEQSVPIKLCVIGVSGKSKSCLGLGDTETCGAIRCHLLNF